MALADVPRCQHVKVNGTQCGSPALRRRKHCFFHNLMLDGHKRFVLNQVQPRPLFSMCLLEDANAVQLALMQVLSLLGSGQMDHRTAGLMLYGLQTASANLRHTTFEATCPTDVVIDRDTVAQTSIDGPQWFEEDYGEEEEEEEQEEESADEINQLKGQEKESPEERQKRDGENPVEALAVRPLDTAELVQLARADLRRLQTEKESAEIVARARRTVQKVCANYILGTTSEKPGSSPG